MPDPVQMCAECGIRPAEPELGALCSVSWDREQRSGLWLGPVLLFCLLVVAAVVIFLVVR